MQLTGLFAMRGWNALVASGSTPERVFIPVVLFLFGCNRDAAATTAAVVAEC